MKNYKDTKVHKQILKTCGTPADFTFEYINDASTKSDVRRMKKYINCVNDVVKKYNIKHSSS